MFGQRLATWWKQAAARRAVTRQEKGEKRAAEERAAIAKRAAEEEQQRVIDAYRKRCADESMFRRIALEEAQNQAWHLVDNLGLDARWERAGGPKDWPERTKREERRRSLVQSFSQQIMAQGAGQYQTMAQQNTWGDANFAQGAEIQNVLGGRSAGNAGSLQFED